MSKSRRTLKMTLILRLMSTPTNRPPQKSATSTTATSRQNRKVSRRGGKRRSGLSENPAFKAKSPVEGIHPGVYSKAIRFHFSGRSND